MRQSFAKLSLELQKMLIKPLKQPELRSMMGNGEKWMIINEENLSTNLPNLSNKTLNGLHISNHSTMVNL